jgi:hypothetical protein
MVGDCKRRSEPDSGDCWDSCCCALIWLFPRRGLGMHMWLHKVSSHAAISVSLHLSFAQPSSSKHNNQPCTQTCSSTNNNMAVLVLYVSGAIAFYIFLRCLLAFTHDAKEPIALATEIPFLSPLIGMRKKARFNIDIRLVLATNVSHFGAHLFAATSSICPYTPCAYLSCDSTSSMQLSSSPSPRNTTVYWTLRQWKRKLLSMSWAQVRRAKRF